ncbi:MAG: adenosylcobinamide-GDP ribazoletransferase, partial [Actinomycetes bacterium]
LVTAAVVGTAAATGWVTDLGAARGAGAALAGLLAAVGLLVHVRRRLGGVSGDVMGALVEVGTAAALLVVAAG